MTRRRFLTSSTSLAAISVTGTGGAQTGPPQRDVYELRRYRVRVGDQRSTTTEYLEKALVPALTRAGFGPTGVFNVTFGDPGIVVLITHRNSESVLTLSSRLEDDSAYVKAASPFRDALATNPTFERVESSLLVAFTGLPRLEPPDVSTRRIFELRRYEQPSDATHIKKIEMFNTGGELDIFRRVGLTPVFFGQTIVGPRMPSFEYLLTFPSPAEREARWTAFRQDPEWKRLSSREAYLDTRIMSSVTSVVLAPAAASQI
ncbi:MAG: NIPSNAP family containing protein [Luteitalea sp.]|nr:NIPSNAP family containing protein [Luteitalea sp.]